VKGVFVCSNAEPHIAKIQFILFHWWQTYTVVSAFLLVVMIKVFFLLVVLKTVSQLARKHLLHHEKSSLFSIGCQENIFSFTIGWQENIY
jgi:hypothetical protein